MWHNINKVRGFGSCLWLIIQLKLFEGLAIYPWRIIKIEKVEGLAICPWLTIKSKRFKRERLFLGALFFFGGYKMTDHTIKIEVEVEGFDEKNLKKNFVEYAFLNNDFFLKDFSDPEEVLDKEKGKKDRESRVYVCIKIEWENNTFLVPLRRNLGNIVFNPLFDKAYFKVPSTKKTKAGLDFRKVILVNDESLYRIDEARISSVQKNIIHENFEEIRELVIDYIKGFIKMASKKRQKREPLYKFSALNNFVDELLELKDRL